MNTQPWGNMQDSQVLVIGHDPRLQRSEAVADYCFFANYYFRAKPTTKPELAKYGLAESLFECVGDLTRHRFTNEQVLVTNLCNEALPPSPKGKTVLIPQSKAEEGLRAIRGLLASSAVQIILPMSQQVNYWLQKLGFYPAVPEFLRDSEPRERGVASGQPYYEPSRSGAFQRVCGNSYVADGKYAIFPILHVKQYPLKGRFLTSYAKHYVNCRNGIADVIDSLEAGSEP